MKKILIVFSSLTIVFFAFSQESVTSPYETMYTHLYNLQEDSYYPEKAALAINPNLLTGESAIEAAIKLKEILDGKGIYVYMNQVPDNPNYIDTNSSKEQYTIALSEPFIYLEKVNGKWYYSAETIEKLPKLYKEVYPFGTRIFNQILPSSVGNTTFFFFKIWQWLGIGIILLAGFILHMLLKLVSKGISKILLKRNILRGERYNEKFDKFLQSLGLVLIISLIRVLVPSLQFDPKFASLIIKSLNILLIFLSAIAVRRLIYFFLEYVKTYTEKTSSKLDEQLLPVSRTLISILIFIIAFSLALKQLEVNLTAIIAGLSIGGLALALASQDTVKNFIGSITIFFDHPFEIDDYIIVSDTEGTVEEVGMRATRIRTPNQSIAYIPNGELSNMVIDNFGLRSYRRWNLTLGVEYGTSTKKIQEFCDLITKMLEDLDYIADHKSLVKLNSLADFSINIFCMIFIDVNTYNRELETKHEILMKIIDIANEIGVEFAFPTQTLHVVKNTYNENK